VDWIEFDRDVIGGSYTNHHGDGPHTMITLAPQAAEHPILAGVDVPHMLGKGSLYQVSPLQPTATPLLIGTIPDADEEPIAWLNRRSDGGLTFYTSLGHTGDFEQPAFQQLLKNACAWLVNQPAR
jgi:type 1 glutamine amidotransferase